MTIAPVVGDRKLGEHRYGSETMKSAGIGFTAIVTTQPTNIRPAPALAPMH